MIIFESRDTTMLQNKRPLRRTYYNGLTYAIRTAQDNTLFICPKPTGPTIRVERFCNLNRGYTIEDYLTDNGYWEVSDDAVQSD